MEQKFSYLIGHRFHTGYIKESEDVDIFKYEDGSLKIHIKSFELPFFTISNMVSYSANKFKIKTSDGHKIMYAMNSILEFEAYISLELADGIYFNAPVIRDNADKITEDQIRDIADELLNIIKI